MVAPRLYPFIATSYTTGRIPNRSSKSSDLNTTWAGRNRREWKESRSIFNIEVSRDGVEWRSKYRFESSKSFQYPSLHEYRSEVYLTVTQGDTSPSRKEHIMLGKLE